MTAAFLRALASRALLVDGGAGEGVEAEAPSTMAAVTTQTVVDTRTEADRIAGAVAEGTASEAEEGNPVGLEDAAGGEDEGKADSNRLAPTRSRRRTTTRQAQISTPITQTSVPARRPGMSRRKTTPRRRRRAPRAARG